MSQLCVLLALVLSLVIALLAIANNQPVALNYLYGSKEVSTVVVILGSAILGALTTFILGLFGIIKKRLQLRGLRNEVKMLKEKLQSLEGERDALLLQISQLQEEVAGTAKAVETGEESGAFSAAFAGAAQDREDGSADNGSGVWEETDKREEKQS